MPNGYLQWLLSLISKTCSALDVWRVLFLVKRTEDDIPSIKIANVWLWKNWSLFFPRKKIGSFPATLETEIFTILRSGTWDKSLQKNCNLTMRYWAFLFEGKLDPFSSHYFAIPFRWHWKVAGKTYWHNLKKTSIYFFLVTLNRKIDSGRLRWTTQEDLYIQIYWN